MQLEENSIFDHKMEEMGVGEKTLSHYFFPQPVYWKFKIFTNFK